MSDGDRQPVLTGDALVDKINDVLIPARSWSLARMA